jgi:D-threonate/D-erythronate kinase
MVRLGVVADDLTGACDSALPFLAAGPVRVGIWPCFPSGDLACAAVSTESREAGPGESRTRSREAVSRLDVRLLFRKLDSLLRGQPVADLRGALEATGATCVVAPALPGEGRVTAGGVQRWAGGQVDLAALLRPFGERVDVRDAATDEDLDAIAGEIVARGDPLAAGTAGLAAALARALGLGPPPRAPAPGCRRPLAVVGSPTAAGQAAHAREKGWAVLVVGPGELPPLEGHDGLVLTGGETAARVLGAHGAGGLELIGEALPRAPMCRVIGGRFAGMPVVLKAGAFGGVDTVARAMELLRAGPA